MSFTGINFKIDPRVQDITIVRNAGNQSTVMIMEGTGGDTGRRRIDVESDFEFTGKFPDDCGLIRGDLIMTADSQYYIIMSLEAEWFRGEISFYRAMMFKCNSTVTFLTFNSVTKKHDIEAKTNVHCLIVPNAGIVRDDKSFVAKGYSGGKGALGLYMQASEELSSVGDVVLKDQNNRRFRINKQIDYWLGDGIIRTSVVWEN